MRIASERGHVAGFSLIEMIAVILIIAIGVGGTMFAIDRITATMPEPLMRKQAIAIADAFLAEVMSQSFNPLAGPAGAPSQSARASFNDMMDYNGYSETGVYTPIGAAPLTGLESYTVTISVTTAPADLAAALPSAPAVPGIDQRHVRVTVASPRETVVLDGYRLKR